MGGWESPHLGCRPPKDETTFRVKGTAYSSKQTSFALSTKFNMWNVVKLNIYYFHLFKTWVKAGRGNASKV